MVDETATGKILILDSEEKFGLADAGHTARNCGLTEEDEILIQLFMDAYDSIIIPHDDLANGKIEAIPEEYRSRIVIVSSLGLNSFQKEVYTKLGVPICIKADEIVELVGNLMKPVPFYVELSKLLEKER